MKIKTDVLQKALDFLSMGVAKSLDKYETELIEFETSNGKLKAYTNDGVNKLGMRICDTTDDFNVTLKFDMLYNLVKACKDDEIELKPAKNYTTFTTNTLSCRISTFTHKLDRPVFPTYDSKMKSENIKSAIPIIKSMLDEKHVEECYRYVYFGDHIMVSDTDNVIIINENLFNNILVQMHSLLILTMFDEFDYICGQRSFCAHSDGRIVEFNLMDKTKFQYDDMLELFKTTSKNSLVIEKTVLQNALNIALLFDTENVDVVFDENGVRIEIPAANFKYSLSNHRCIDKTYTMPISLLKKMLVLGDQLTIGYDSDDLVYVESGIYKAIYGVPNNAN